MHVFWGMKKIVQLKFVQLLLLNRVKGKMIKKTCCSRFLLHKFVQLKCFWTQFKNVQLQGPCSLRPCISRPYCMRKIWYYQIWIQNNLGFMVLILIYIPLRLHSPCFDSILLLPKCICTYWVYFFVFIVCNV